MEDNYSSPNVVAANLSLKQDVRYRSRSLAFHYEGLLSGIHQPFIF
jgi:hypothetical protein